MRALIRSIAFGSLAMLAFACTSSTATTGSRTNPSVAPQSNPVIPSAPTASSVNTSMPRVDGNPTTTASGLQYIDISPGDGPTAQAGQIVRVHYTGWLESNGQKFDSSVDRGQPFTFKLGAGQVIKGWDEGVAGMKPGGKRKLTIPAELGYGSRGAGGVIPPNAELTFEVELLKIRK